MKLAQTIGSSGPQTAHMLWLAISLMCFSCNHCFPRHLGQHHIIRLSYSIWKFRGCRHHPQCMTHVAKQSLWKKFSHHMYKGEIQCDMLLKLFARHVWKVRVWKMNHKVWKWKSNIYIMQPVIITWLEQKCVCIIVSSLKTVSRRPRLYVLNDRGLDRLSAAFYFLQLFLKNPTWIFNMKK